MISGDPIDRWDPCSPRIEHLGGPARIYDNDPEPFTPRRVGFGVIPEPATDVTPHAESDPVAEQPLIWEGDDS